MRGFHYSGGSLYVENVPLTRVAEQFGTPCYVYSRAEIEYQWHAYDLALQGRPHLICYAVKANGNLAILDILSRLGSGFDVVSAGELHRVIKAGGDPRKVVFSGVGKHPLEMKAALDAGIRCFNVESISELHRLNAVAAQMNTVAPVSIRVNPDVDANTHPYISTGLKENKFGIDIEEAVAVFVQATGLANLKPVGIDCHIGSQITSVGPYEDACSRIVQLFNRLSARGISLQHIDIGGGLGISYHDETPPSPSELIKSVCDVIEDDAIELIVEPGRSIVANAGVLLTEILYLKPGRHRNFAIVDAAMNDLIRPVLYDAWQDILPVKQDSAAEPLSYDIVGPVCETGDFLGLNRTLSVTEGDLLAVCSAGAYGFCMSSNYNARVRAAEILIDGDDVHEIRRREGFEDLCRGETLLQK